MLPPADNPEAFGQHSNADIASQIQETRLLFDTLLSLQPQVATGGGESKEDKVKLHKMEEYVVNSGDIFVEGLGFEEFMNCFIGCFIGTISLLIIL